MNVRRAISGIAILAILASLLVISHGMASQAATTFKLPYPAGTEYYLTNLPGETSHVGLGVNAYDFGLPEGSEVVAAAEGDVVMASDTSTVEGCSFANWPKGNYVVVRHNDATSTLYLHLKPGSIKVRNGHVLQGQPIAQSGKTGYTCNFAGTGPGAHLHFQLQRNDQCDSTYRWFCSSVPVQFADHPQPLNRATPVRSGNTPPTVAPTKQPAPTKTTPAKSSLPQTPYVIVGSVFDDVNRNQKRDGGEKGVADISVKLSGSASDSAVTDSSGKYALGINEPGLYTIRVTAPSGYSVMGLNPRSIAVNVAQTTVDFGIAKMPTPTPTSAATSTPTPSPTPTATPSPTPTLMPTMTPTPIPTPPRPPSDAHLTLLDPNHLQLTWADQSDNETGFEVWWINTQGPEPDIFLSTVPAGSTSYVWEDDFPQREGAMVFAECLEVRAVNDAGSSDFVDTCFENPPTTPTNLFALMSPKGVIAISWIEEFPSVDGFRVYYQEGGGNWMLIEELPDDATGTNFMWQDYFGDKLYPADPCWGVTAFNGTGESEKATICFPVQ